MKGVAYKSKQDSVVHAQACPTSPYVPYTTHTVNPDITPWYKNFHPSHDQTTSWPVINYTQHLSMLNAHILYTNTVKYVPCRSLIA